MKIISREDQQKVYKHLVEIIKVLATVDGDEATDAICGAYQIAGLVGGGEMIRAMEVRNDNSINRRCSRGRGFIGTRVWRVCGRHNGLEEWR